MGNAAIQIRPAARADAPSRYRTRSEIPSDVDERFLSALSEFGQVTYAANVSGMARRSLYERRRRDPEFAAKWDEAIDTFEETLTQRVIATALHMGTGRWVPATDPDTGEAELDEDFEPVMRFDCSNVDPRIAVRLIGLRISGVNEAATVAIQNNVVAPSAPKLVSGAPIDVDAILAEYEDLGIDDE